MGSPVELHLGVFLPKPAQRVSGTELQALLFRVKQRQLEQDKDDAGLPPGSSAEGAMGGLTPGDVV